MNQYNTSNMVSEMNGYLNKVNHTFFDAVVKLDQILNSDIEKDDYRTALVFRLSLLAHIQDSLYNSDEYSQLSFRDLRIAVDTKLALPGITLDLISVECVKFIKSFDEFGYTSDRKEEIVEYHKLILRIWLYHNSYVPTDDIIFRGDLTDDYFEWFIYHKLKDDSLETRCVGMHDAWALALLYGVQHTGEKYVFNPKKEKGLYPHITDEIDAAIPIINRVNQEIDTTSFGKKDLVKIEFDDLFNVEKRTLRVENRRLPQLVDYAHLTAEEKIKDLVPALVCFYVTNILVL